MKPPNILFILADQHNAKVLGHKGHPQVKTPHLDALAASGVRFDRAVAQNPICTPSRTSFMSGQYPHNHGYFGLGGPKPEGLPSLFSQFKQAGYLTGAIGKIHCPEFWIEAGCDIFHETCISHHGESNAYRDFLIERGKLELEDHIGIQEFGNRGRQSLDSRPSTLPFEESMEGWIVSQINEAIDQSAEQAKPFFLHASLPRPHQCTTPSEPFWSMYEGLELQLPPNADDELRDRAPHMRQAADNWRNGAWALFDPPTFEAARKRKLHGYLGAVSQVDHAVGLMLAHLDKLGLREDTLIVYSSDHGDYACEHGIMEKAPGICSDAITRIPMIWSWKGHLPEGKVCEEWVEAVDTSATFYSLAGIEPPTTLDGADLSPLLRGKSIPWKSGALTECPWSKAFCSGEYRLVYYPDQMFAQEHPEGFGELYHLKEDPCERKNLYCNPAYADVVHRLRKQLFDRLITTTRLITRHPPAQAPLNSGPEAARHYLSPDGKCSPPPQADDSATPNQNYL